MTPDNPWKDAEQDEVSDKNPLLSPAPENTASSGDISGGLENRVMRVPVKLKMDWLGLSNNWNEFVDYFNVESNKRSQDGRQYFASLPEIYAVLKDIYLNKPADSRDAAIRNTARKIDGKPILTSTVFRKTADQPNTKVEVVHNYRSDREYSIQDVPVPNNLETCKALAQFISSVEGETLARALFGTSDNIIDIWKVMGNWFGQNKISLGNFQGGTSSNPYLAISLLYRERSKTVRNMMMLMDNGLGTKCGALVSCYKDPQGGSE